MTLRLAGKLLIGDSFTPGRITLDGERIMEIEPGEFRPQDVDHWLPDAYIGPGLIDLQLNGALGSDFTGKPAAAADVAAYLPATGVTGYLPTVITAPFETARRALTGLSAVAKSDPDGARILGIHLEGPFINIAHKGAHDPNAIRLPSAEEAAAFVEAAEGYLSIVTLAPELPGALEVARLLRGHGVITSAGHSGATYEQAVAAFEDGFGWVTHVFNAQPPLHHRAPGLSAAALIFRGVTLGLIADGVHVHPAVCDLVYRAKGADGLILVTDAMAALGLGPGRYEIGGAAVEVDETTARLAGKETLAGSIVTMNRSVANMMAFAEVPRHEAWRMGSTVPARLLGLRDMGQLLPGCVADLLVADEDMGVLLTMRGGEVVYRAA